MGSPRDWLSGHVQGTADELARLRSSLKEVQGAQHDQKGPFTYRLPKGVQK